MSFKTIGQIITQPVQGFTRMLRSEMGRRVFRELWKRLIAHTASSRILDIPNLPMERWVTTKLLARTSTRGRCLGTMARK